jgi:hypothetical protein
MWSIWSAGQAPWTIAQTKRWFWYNLAFIFVDLYFLLLGEPASAPACLPFHVVYAVRLAKWCKGLCFQNKRPEDAS